MLPATDSTAISDTSPIMSAGSSSFIQLMKNPVKFRMFLFAKLPSAYFAGVRLKEMDGSRCSVAVPFKWFSQNPFKSTYFACLAMAAEMSTGALAMAHLYKSVPPVSMLITGMEADFKKKATGLTTFVCEDGDLIRDTIKEAIITGEGKLVKAKSVGKNSAGEVIAEFYLHWSFKTRKAR